MGSLLVRRRVGERGIRERNSRVDKTRLKVKRMEQCLVFSTVNVPTVQGPLSAIICLSFFCLRR